jgi:hypothetical protein
MKKIDFQYHIVRDSNGGYVLIRDDFPYDCHAHLKTIHGCKIVVECIEKGKLPKNAWMVGSCKRLLTEDEFQTLRSTKQKYYNSKNRWR